MGGIVGREASRKARDVDLSQEGGGDCFYPWIEIIQWSCEEINKQGVFKWDLQTIKKEVMYAASDAATFLAACSPKYELSKQQFPLNDDSIFFDWASSLLSVNKSLEEVRYRLVPSKISEEIFWRKFFGYAKYTIIQHVLRSIEMEGGDSAAGPDRQTVPFMSPVPNTIGNPQLGGALVGAPIQGGPPVEDSLQDSDTNGYSMHAQQRGDSYEKRIHRGPPRGPPLVYELPVIEPKNRGAPQGGPQGLPQVPSNGAPQGASQPLPQLYEGPPGAPRVYGAPQDGQGPQGFTYEYSPQGPTGVSLGASNV